MATECYNQLGFGFQPKLVVDFTGGTLTTDAGLLLVREFDEQPGLSADVVGRITDTRDARYVTHELDALRANAVRLQLHNLALLLLAYFRRAVLAATTIGAIRLQLLRGAG